MRIEHIAVWTNQLEAMRAFYTEWFGAESGPKYINPAKGFESCFLSFDEGPRLELMTAPGLEGPFVVPCVGYAHLAVSVGSEWAVREKTEQLRAAGFEVAGEPRTTGDGYYESVVLDPDGNRIEITV